MDQRSVDHANRVPAINAWVRLSLISCSVTVTETVVFFVVLALMKSEPRSRLEWRPNSDFPPYHLICAPVTHPDLLGHGNYQPVHHWRPS